MTDGAQAAFWGCAAVILYTYAGYPLLVAAWALLRGTPPEPVGQAQPEHGRLPYVSLIVPAYNEEQVIARKIQNSCELDYPESLLEIVVASDGSSDATEAVSRHAAGDRVHLAFFEDRQGKTACLNKVLPTLRGEVVVFTDANAFFRPDALRILVHCLRNPQVGCAMGELEYVREGSLNASLGEGLYWRYENFIKDCESRLGSTIVGNGAIYAMRRALCRPLPPVVEADVANPLLALGSGYRVVFERKARCWERAAGTVREEFSRKTRIITNQITSYLFGWKDLRPLPMGAVFQIVSHKVLRWLVPFCLAGAFVACVFSRGSRLLDTLLWLQLIFYLSALTGWGLEWLGKPIPRALFLPYYFCAVNVASLKGIADFLRGRRRVTWEKAEGTR